MRDSIQQALKSVWQQSLIDKANYVWLSGAKFRVKKKLLTSLKQVDFVCEGQEVRGVEQSPAGKTHWAQMARDGKLIMQFLYSGYHVANVTDGVLHVYGASMRSRERSRETQASA
jgi:hypothetical protein